MEIGSGIKNVLCGVQLGSSLTETILSGFLGRIFVGLYFEALSPVNFCWLYETFDLVSANLSAFEVSSQGSHDLVHLRNSCICTIYCIIEQGARDKQSQISSIIKKHCSVVHIQKIQQVELSSSCFGTMSCESSSITPVTIGLKEPVIV
eukprot:scaffold55228_cov62-Attheya_sp.AAC.8